MRVITGTARGRKLKAPENYDIRPTTDGVKEAVFNIVQFDVEGRRVLDLFAGTGQLGIEALSRGARECVFVDSDKTAAAIVRDNLRACALAGQVYQSDALSYLDGCGKFDLIFLDPPYDSGLYDEIVHKINLVDILSDGGIIICESRRETPMPAVSAPYFAGREYVYGKVKITVYRRENSI